MRLFRGMIASVASGAVPLLASSIAFGQADVSAEAETELNAEGTAPTEVADAEGGTEVGAADATAAADQEAATETDAAGDADQEPAVAPAEKMVADEGAAEETGEALANEPTRKEAPVEESMAEESVAVEDVPAEETSVGSFNYMLFGDAYATMQTAQVGSAAPGHRAYASSTFDGTADVDGDGTSDLAEGAMLNENGFSLAFAGLDLGYEGKGWGVTTNLRFGPGVTEYYAIDPVLGGVGAITQAYVTWAPIDSLSLDFGQFGTIFGAEVAESWNNLNYTRGALYYAMQPFWHTGLRAGIGLSDSMSLTLMLVNDANQISLAPTSDLQAAAQLGINAGDLGLAVGTLQTLGTANAFVDRFFDVVVTYTTGGFSLIFNGDLNVADLPGEAFGGSTFYGLSLAAGYEFSDMFGVALRGEFLDNDMDVENDEVATGTLTLDTRPVPGAENVVLRWDNRIEGGPTGAFNDGGGDPTDLWFASTIGLAISTDGTF